MTLIQLEYVLAVAESKNFTIAAKKSHVTQPTLSMQIQKFEAELGVNIFDRSTHPITITKIGEKILDQSKKILGEVNRMQFIVSEEKENLSGEFKIGVIPTIMPTLVPLFYRNFKNKFKEAELTITEMKTEEIIEALHKNEIDFGIAVTPLHHPNIFEEVLYYEPLLAFIPKEHRLHNKQKINIEDLDIKDLILLEQGHCFRNNVLSICQNSNAKTKPLGVESGNFQTLMKLSKEGFGMTVIPALSAIDLNKEDLGLIKQFHDPIPTREVSLIYHSHQLRLTFAKELQKLIRSLVRGLIYLESQNTTLPYLDKK